jgi:hypothetical protein
VVFCFWIARIINGVNCRLMSWSLEDLTSLSRLPTALNTSILWLIINLINKYEHSAVLSNRWVRYTVWMLRLLLHAV